MHALITGGAGFIGSHLCEKLLSEGHRVTSVDNFSDYYDPAIKRKNICIIQSQKKAKNFVSLRGDITNTSSFSRILKKQKPDVVVHLAAMAGVRPSIEKPALYADVNVRGTFNLLELCHEHGIRHVIFGSSSSVYGNLKKGPFSETDPTGEPISPYAATKKAGEILCEFYARTHGIHVTALRFFTAYGPRQRPDLAIHKFTRLILRGEKIPFYGDGSMKRDYTYIDDIVSGIVLALNWTVSSKKSGQWEIFNLGESRSIALKDMVAVLEKACGKKARLLCFPKPAGDVDRTDADISKARRVLGYKPSTYFERGVKNFVTWYQSENKGECFL